MTTGNTVVAAGGARVTARWPIVARICLRCGAHFHRPLYDVQRGKALYCGRSCASSAVTVRRHKATPQVGARNPNWRGGRSLDHLYYKHRFRARHPEKARAHDAVRRAMRRGMLVRPAACQRCGVVGKTAAHHDDYTKPLSVRFLCRPCHRLADKARQVTDARHNFRRSA